MARRDVLTGAQACILRTCDNGARATQPCADRTAAAKRAHILHLQPARLRRHLQPGQFIGQISLGNFRPVSAATQPQPITNILPPQRGDAR